MKLNSSDFMIFSLLMFSLLPAASPKPIVLRPDYDHDRWNTQPKDIVRMFEAYTVSFDGPDDDDGDQTPDLRANPEWVSYEIKAFTNASMPRYKRPSSWFTDTELFKRGWAADDETYSFDKIFREKFPGSSQIGYDRGHLCMKQIASRLGEEADWNTHTLLNACPQKHDFNARIWLDLEIKTGEWADRYGKVWVICGPVFEGKKSKNWLGEENEIKVAIPDGFFKIVIREGTNRMSTTNTTALWFEKPEILSFLYSQNDTNKSPYQQEKHLVTIKEIEDKTGLRFLSHMPESAARPLKTARPDRLWP